MLLEPPLSEDYPEDLDATRRLCWAAQMFYDAMPEELRAECHTLASLDASALGMRVQYIPADDVYTLTWVGRWMGDVAGAFVRGEMTE